MTQPAITPADAKEPVIELTDRVRSLGMWWELEGRDAFLQGNTEALSEPLLAELRTHKVEIVAYLDEERAALSQLEARLDRGWTVCEGETDPARRARYDDRWIALLHDYETRADRIGALFGEPMP